MKKPAGLEFSQPTTLYLRPDVVGDGVSVRTEDNPLALDELVQSARQRGILQPIRVCPDGDGRYKCTLGHRRLKAARLANLAAVPCIVDEDAPDRGAIVLDQLVENLMRADLKPMDAARGFREIMDLRSWSARQLGERIGIHHGTISRALQVLDGPADLVEQVESGGLPLSTAGEILRLPDADRQGVIERVEAGDQLPTRNDAKNLRTPGPKLARFKFVSPRRRRKGGWRIDLVATKERATQEEAVIELEALVAELKKPAEPDDGEALPFPNAA